MLVDRGQDWGEGIECKESQPHYVVLGKVAFLNVSTGAMTEASAVDSPSQPSYFNHPDETQNHLQYLFHY